MSRPSFDKTLELALAIFRKEYAECFPTGGDAADHDEATRAGIEAVLIGTPIPCRHCGEDT